MNMYLESIYNIDNYKTEIEHTLQKTNILARTLIEKHKRKNKSFYDKHAKPTELKIGDNALLKKYYLLN